MAFFKFRKGADEAPAATGQTESVEALRRRARHRLIGAAVLVALGIVGFPLLFDTQPRPVAVDIPIEIPDRNKAKPLPPAPRAQGAVVEQDTAPAPAASRAAPAVNVAAAAPASRPVASAPVREPAKPEQVAKAVPAPVDKPAAPETKPTPKPAPADAARAQALLEGKPVQAAAQDAAAEGRFVVQVGAFADNAKAREARLKVEKAGLKTYTQVAETKDGKRIRVRVGPFATRAEADKAAGRIKELELPAAILTL